MDSKTRDTRFLERGREGRPMIRWALIAVLVIHSVQVVKAEELTEAKKQDIHELLRTTGATLIGEQMSGMVTAQMTQVVRELRPDVSPEIVEIIRTSVADSMAESVPALLDLVVPLYAEHLTHEEIKGLIRFYNSQLGKKVITLMPTLIQQSSVLAQQRWAPMVQEKVQRRLRERLKAEGIDLPDA